MDTSPPLSELPELPELAHDVVVVGGSAGGLAALRTLLEGLAPDFPLPVLAMLHLPAGAEAEATLQRLPLRVQRLQPGQVLAPGALWMCPPRSAVELLPDGRCVVGDSPGGALDRPIDRLLASTARSFGPRAIGVILTGMGNDGAVGARELHAAGGRVLVQSPASADYPDMPNAAIAAGAADLVVPQQDLGEVVAEFARGAPRTRARSELRAVAAAFGERGDVANAALDVDWQATPLGAVLAWPDSLKLLVRETLDASDASALWWGVQHIEIYNDAWRGFLGARHPEALGRPARQNWQTQEHAWDRIGLLAEQVMSSGRAVAGEQLALRVGRAGTREEVFASFSCTPLRNLAGQVLGLRCTLWETTRDVVADRRLQLLRALGTAMARATHRHEACSLAAEALAAAPHDVAFALIYLVDSTRRQATLACTAGLPPGSAAAPRLAYLVDAPSGTGQWPLERALPGPLAAPAPVLVDDLTERFPQLSAALVMDQDSPELTRPRAVLVPLDAQHGQPHGVAVIGLPAHRPLDDTHSRFLEVLGQQMAAGLGDARAKELERERGDRLAALDRARTDFFSNVSHEFRTPLTLLLAPLEELAREREALPQRVGAELDVAVRNARRLLRLVDSLLDFSQIDGRGRQALLAPTELGPLTEDIVSAFRSAIEAAGLALRVDIQAGLPPVPVNAAMWEQIVSNLLSNALKFTFEGAITVRLKALRLHVELEVSDSGIGIAPEDLSNVFKRFHRVQGARARTSEGSGIGLALVQDLVQRLGGQLSARSTPGQGSTFTIWLPLKSRQALAEPVGDGLAAPPSKLAVDLAGEASRWSGGAPPEGVVEDMLAPLAGGGHVQGLPQRLLVADDNADLRNYLRRLLGAHWEVQLAANGTQALALALEQPPDLLLADVMMPELDGFALLQRWRETPRLAAVPVILLTARASEEAAIEGLRAGADDYIAKPFSPRELVARLQAALGRARAEAALRESEARFRAVFETMIEACCFFEMIYDDRGEPVDWRILEANPGYERESGLKDVAGRLASEVMPGTEAYWLETFGRVAATGEGEQIERWHQPTGRWVHSSTARVGGPGSRRLVSVFYDITERKQAEMALRDSEAHLAQELQDARVLQDISNQLVSEGGLNGHYRHVVEAARMLMRSDAASIQELDASDVRLNLLAHTGFHPESAAFWACVDADVGTSCGRALTARKRVLVPDMDEFDADPDDVAAYRKSAIMAVQSTPLVASSGRIVGMMSTHWRQRCTPNPESYRFFDVLARLAADFMERARTKTALRESEERQAFLLKLSDALRPLADASQIIQSACRVLGEHTRADRALYADVSDEKTVVIGPNHVNEGVPTIEQALNAEDFGQGLVAAYKRGEKVVFSDVNTVPTFTTQDRRNFVSIGVVANVSVPLVKGGRWVGVMGLHHCTPRTWTPFEVALVEQTAERVWGAIERARVEMALRDSEERFRNVLNAMAEGFALFAPDFTILDVNDETCRLDGRSRAELVGRSHWEAFPGTEQSELGALFRRVMERRVAGALEHRYVWPDGRDMWVDARVYPTPGGNVAVFWRDSTGRKRAEERLRDSELKYRSLFDAIDEGFITAELMLDADGDVVDALYLEGNPAASRMIGGAGVDGRLLSEVVPDAKAYWLAIYAEVARTGIAQRLERHLLPMQRCYSFHVSRVPHADDQGRHRRVAVVFQDVTERRLAEDALRRREAELARVQRIGEIGGMDIDVAQGLTSRRSPEYLRLHGLPEDVDVETHQDWLARIHPDDREQAEQRLLASLRGDAALYENEYRIVRPSDGEVRWIQVRADIERDAQGQALRIVGAHLDVTDRKRRDGG